MKTNSRNGRGKLLRKPLVIFLASFLILALLGFTLFSFIGVAEQNISNNIGRGTYLSGSANLPMGGLLSYDLDVTSGDPVDIYVMEESEMSNWINHRSFDFVQEASHTNVTHAETDVFLPAGQYRLVVVPSGFSSSSVSLSNHGGPTIMQLIIIPIFALIIAAVISLIAWRRQKRNRRKEMANAQVAPASIE
jgi:hypothetical protein